MWVLVSRKFPELGKQTFFLEVRKSLAHSAIANPQISYVCQSANRKSENFHNSPQVANSQNLQTQNSPKNRLFKMTALLIRGDL